MHCLVINVYFQNYVLLCKRILEIDYFYCRNSTYGPNINLKLRILIWILKIWSIENFWKIVKLEKAKFKMYLNIYQHVIMCLSLSVPPQDFKFLRNKYFIN